MELTAPRRAAPPWVFFLLILPYGTSFGFISFAFAYLATHSDHPLSEKQVISIVAVAFVPHTFKVLWAPVVDQTLTKKAWYLIALVLTGLGTIAVAAMPLTPDQIPVITVTVLLAQVGLTLMGMACEAFLGLTVPEEHKGKASGWYNAGNNFGNGVGGGVALWLSQHLPKHWMSGAVMGALMLLCGLGLLAFDEPVREHLGAVKSKVSRILASLEELFRNVTEIFTSRTGIVAFVMAASPIAAGASSNLFAPAADHWQVSANVVAMVGGLLGGLVMSGGSLAGGFLADRMRRKILYALSGGLMATTAVLLAVCPKTPVSYVLLTSVYSFFFGIAYTAFTAFVLEVIGKGAVATKYNLFTLAMNGAMTYMGLVIAQADGKWGVKGALLTDAGCTFAAIVLVLVLIAVVLRGAKTSTPSAETT